MFFSFCELVRRSLRSSGPATQVCGYYKMLFQVINQHKKHMARVCNLYRERVRSIKTVLFLIIASVSLSSEETVPTKCRPCQKKSWQQQWQQLKIRRKESKTKWKYWADELKQKQNCWKQFVETNSKTSQVGWEQTWRMLWNKSDRTRN